MLPRVLVAGIAGAVVSFIGGFLIWGIALSSYFQSTVSPAGKAIMSTQPDFVPLTMAQLAFGIFFAIILEWSGSRSLTSGALAGAVLGFFISFLMNMQVIAFMNMHVGSPYTPAAVDIICATVMGAVVGAVVGMVLGMMNKGSNATVEA